ncbi:MAG: carboxypeptidase-like regulatory domain-containing protein, partial [Candidatus Cryptobacteroides sp.]
MRHKLFYLALSLGLVLTPFRMSAQVDVHISALPLKQALAEVEKQSGYSFFYSNLLPNLDVLVTLDLENSSIEKVMDKLVKGLDIQYEIKEDKQIVLTEKASDKNGSDKTSAIRVNGRVLDTANLPLSGVGVAIDGTSSGTITDDEGCYVLEVPSEDCVLDFMFLGFQGVKERVGSRREINVCLREDSEFLEEVVVVGYGTQKKVNLTGSVSMVGSEDISGLNDKLPCIIVCGENRIR